MHNGARGAAAARTAAAALVVLLAAAALAAYQYRHTRGGWSADGSIYARIALEDRGLSRDAARREVDAFMLRTTDAANPTSRGFYGDAPPEHFARQFDLFRARPLYPALAAPLIPRFGLDALRVVSAAASVIGALAMFALLLAVARPPLAALGALAYAASPPVRDLSAAPLTDALALAAWVAVLALVAHALRGPRRDALAVAAGIAALALTFTRPAWLLPVAAAAGALWAVPRARRRDLFVLAGALCAAAAASIVFTAAVHGPGIGEQLRWEYGWARATGATAASPAGWYARALAHGVFVLIAAVFYDGAWLLGAAFAVAGYARTAARRFVPLAAACILAEVPTLLVNPVDVMRTVVVPLVPVVMLGIVAALARSVDGERPAPRA